MDGKIKRKVKDKGFGFLEGADGIERFFHHSELKNIAWDQLTEGAAVSFQPQKHPKGDRAGDIYVK